MSAGGEWLTDPCTPKLRPGSFSVSVIVPADSSLESVTYYVSKAWPTITLNVYSKYLIVNVLFFQVILLYSAVQTASTVCAHPLRVGCVVSTV